MAVVVLLSLAMVMLAGTLVRGDSNARVKSTAREILDLDRRARLLAATDGAMTIARDQHGGAVLLKRAVSGERVAAVRVAPDLTVHLLDVETGVVFESIRVGAHGRSRDYIVAVRRARAAERAGPHEKRTTEKAWRVDGLTGSVGPVAGGRDSDPGAGERGDR